MYQDLKTVFSSLDFSTISSERKQVLQPLIDYIKEKAEKQQEINLNFICTHNSRRSHLSQIWSQAAAAYYQVDKVSCYSGGTEATALYPMVAKVLDETGFQVFRLSEASNPVYAIKYSENSNPIIGFSKRYEHDFNPVNGFAAIMTCSQADGGCPFIAGAEKRVPITFEDPKAFDNTPLQKEKYQERSLQIATEMAFVFYSVKN
ncbi:MAG TPA: hypothetical protein VKZ97_05665 [Flavobacteriaceae bacterium]|nr:hypothetical protein [Flavobacteriaceae bacterium]